MTPNELHRIFASLTSRAIRNQEFFGGIDADHYGVGALVGNAEYVLSQAEDYLRAEKAYAGEPHELAYRAHCRSDIARILALLHRQCLIHNMEFAEVLAEGVEYEEAVVKDIREGRRTARSHKGLNAKEAKS